MGLKINPASSPSYPYHNDFGNDKSTSIFDNPTFNQKSIGFEDEEPFIKGGINLGGTNTFNSIRIIKSWFTYFWIRFL